MNVTVRLKLAELGQPLDVKPAVALPGCGGGAAPGGPGGERKDDEAGKWREETRDAAAKGVGGWEHVGPRRVKQEA